jgi:hypothetical protein
VERGAATFAPALGTSRRKCDLLHVRIDETRVNEGGSSGPQDADNHRNQRRHVSDRH